MKLVSVNLGSHLEVSWRRSKTIAAIYKQPAGGCGAFYCYPRILYGYWTRELPGHELPIGVFGENFTTDGLLEDSVHLGDRLSVGSAQMVVTQPFLATNLVSPKAWV
jgi:MOSC domain-containing protein YiiM